MTVLYNTLKCRAFVSSVWKFINKQKRVVLDSTPKTLINRRTLDRLRRLRLYIFIFSDYIDDYPSINTFIIVVFLGPDGCTADNLPIMLLITRTL